MKKTKIKLKKAFIPTMNKMKNLSKYDKMTYLWTGFFVLGFFIIINVVIMSLHLISNRDEFKILNNTYVNAVLPEQDLNNKLDLGIVKIKKFDISKIENNSKVIIKNDFSIDVFWVEDVVSIDVENSLVNITYDQITSNSFGEDDIIGVYVEDASFFGSIYYASSFIRGFLFLSATHIFILFGYYYIFLNKKDHQRGTKNEDIN